MANLAELASYQECDCEEYEFIATLDLRTSEVCQQLDGKRFKTKNARPGVNLPPMHPNCRSTTGAHFDWETVTDMQRRAYDPKTGESTLIPGDMTYPQWRKSLTLDDKSGIILSGGKSGAITDPIRQSKHADRYYDEVRKRTGDSEKIANNIGWKPEAIEDIRKHVFVDEHMLDGKMQRFSPDYDQSECWRRLLIGKSQIKDSDLVFLKHEYVELTQMKLHGLSYDDAHAIANKYHNWQKMIENGDDH